MKLTTIREIYKQRENYLDQEITVGGWVRSVRDSKTFGFIVLHDGSFFETLQIVYHDAMSNFAEISKLNVGAAIAGLVGIVVMISIVVTLARRANRNIQEEYRLDGPRTAVTR